MGAPFLRKSAARRKVTEWQETGLQSKPLNFQDIRPYRMTQELPPASAGENHQSYFGSTGDFFPFPANILVATFSRLTEMRARCRDVRNLLMCRNTDEREQYRTISCIGNRHHAIEYRRVCADIR